MDFNNGKMLSPWKIPSKISLKRLQDRINSDLNNSNVSTTNSEKNSTKNNGKRNRLMINKFALARSISTPKSEENPPEKNPTEDEHFLAKLQQIVASTTTTLNSAEQSNYHSTMKNFSFEQTFSSNESTNKTTNENLVEFPTDWSLKCFCRFSTRTPSTLISQLTKLRSIDESQALDYICSSSPNIDNSKALFRCLTSYWTYPHLPWLKLFPRSQQNLSSNGTSLDESSQQSVQDEWKIAFQSLFQSFRTKYSPYFYLCTHTFNVLFREDIQHQFIVIISPTTTGFRSTLENEGIEFSMADGGDLILNNSMTKPNEKDENQEEENPDEDEEEEEEETCEQWLEGIGLSSHSTTTSNCSNLTKKKVNMSEEKTRSTTILIREISSINSLFNFLLNKSQRVCIPLTGPLTGIPPTLISPRPFLYSTLKYLNVQIQSNQMLTIDGGPILPDRLKNLWKLFQENHDEVQLNSLHFDRTSMFNFHLEEHRTIKQIEKTLENQLYLQSFPI